jgi:hypothetical protein
MIRVLSKRNECDIPNADFIKGKFVEMNLTLLSIWRIVVKYISIYIW